MRTTDDDMKTQERKWMFQAYGGTESSLKILREHGLNIPEYKLGDIVDHSLVNQECLDYIADKGWLLTTSSYTGVVVLRELDPTGMQWDLISTGTDIPQAVASAISIPLTKLPISQKGLSIKRGSE